MKSILDYIKKHWLIILLSGTCVLLALIISIMYGNMYGKMFCLPVKQIDNQECIRRLEQRLSEALERANKAVSNSKQAQDKLAKLKQIAQRLNTTGTNQAKTLGQQKEQQNVSTQNSYANVEASKFNKRPGLTSQEHTSPALSEQDLDGLEDELNGINSLGCEYQQSQSETRRGQEQQNMTLGSAASTQCTDQPCIATGGVQLSNNTQVTTTSPQNKPSEDTTRQYKDLQDLSQKLDQQFAQRQVIFMEQQAKETQKHCEQTINDSLKKSLRAALG